MNNCFNGTTPKLLRDKSIQFERNLLSTYYVSYTTLLRGGGTVEMPKRKRELLRKSAASGVKGEDSGLKEKS